MIPWLIFALVAVPLLVVCFVVARRRTVEGERDVTNDAATHAKSEQEFAEAEDYEAKWHEQDKERFQHERLP